jgi:putative ABC transport system permease protein
MYGALGNFASAGSDLAVLGFAVLASVASVILSGLAPALQAGRTDLAAELKDRSASAGAPRGDGRAQSMLVVVEIALALVLSLGAGLLFSSLRQLQAVPLGFDPAGVLTFRIQPSEVRFGPAEAPALLDRVLAQLAAVPGVRSASVDGCAPVGPACAYSSLYIAGRPQAVPGREPGVTRHYVGPEHFTTLGVPLLRGRAFTNDDRADRPKVAVINETAARRFWPGASPLGQHIWVGSGTVSSPDSSAEIVGVVGDVPYGSLERGAVASVYTPYRQFTYASRTVLVKADGDPIALVPAVRRAVRQVEDLPIFAVRSMNDQLADAWAGTRFNAMFLGVFAGVALLLAVSGVYGVVSHSVSQRTRELGIRVALGASVGDVLGLVLRQGLALAGLGMVLGLVAALALGRVIRSMLFGVSPADPILLVIQGLLLVSVALAASYFPARRAAGVDPVDALRAE